MSLREELIEAGAKVEAERNRGFGAFVSERDRTHVESLLDAFLDLLTERADEWEDLAMAAELPGNMAPALLAVLRNPGSRLPETCRHGMTTMHDSPDGESRCAGPIGAALRNPGSSK